MQTTGETPAQVNVAVLDEKQLSLDSLAELLRHAPFNIAFATTSRAEFERSLQRTGADIAVVSLGRDDRTRLGNSAELLQALRDWHAEVPVLVLSESNDPAEVDRCMHFGAEGYLDKYSANAQMLIAAVRAVVAGERIFPFPGSLFSPSARPPEPRASVLDQLTTREREVLRYVGTGADNMKIAANLDITERTVRAHISALYRKLGSENRAQLALLARSLGVHPPEMMA
jgi:two-component system, NarL family, nitrate/nitrite response regulator NarL